MDIEYDIIIMTGTFVIVLWRLGIILIPLRWLFKYKFNVAGFITKYKARIVTCGDKELFISKDYYAAILVFKMWRILMALANTFNLII